MDYRTQAGVQLDISAMGRGEQQTLLLLAHMAMNPGAVLLLDEPDAHLEILRQRQIYDELSKQAERTGSQLIIASHSEVILNEAADRDVVIAFLGRPHRINDRGSQVLKSLREVGWRDYYLARQTGWVLYVEGSTDLATLQAFARRLGHPADLVLQRAFFKEVGNQPRKAQEHFYALREAQPDLRGIAIYDRLERELPEDPNLKHHMWSRRELENYLAQRQTLFAFAETRARQHVVGDLFVAGWKSAMERAIQEVEHALITLGKDPSSPDIKASDEFLAPVFAKFYKELNLPDEMTKTNYHILAEYVSKEDISSEIVEVLDAIHEIATGGRQTGP